MKFPQIAASALPFLRRLAGRVLRAIPLIACFVAGLAGVSWAIGRELPFLAVPIVRQKLLYFTQNAAKYDTLYIGSSRIQYQIIPAMFDELAARGGVKTTSFNGGIAGISPPEDAYVLDYYLRDRPANIRWVFIELAGIRTRIGDTKRGTLRALYWHDLERTWTMWRRVFAEKIEDIEKRKKKGSKLRWKDKWNDVQEPLSQFLEHLGLFARMSTNFGRGTILSDKLMFPSRPPDNIGTSELGDDLAGWIPTGRPEEMEDPELTAFEEGRAAREKEPARDDYADTVSQEAIDRMVEKVRKLGATPVLIVPPTTSKKNFVPYGKARAEIVLDFSDLKKYPELYANENRLDTDHLNTPGSEVFTRLVAERFLEEVKKRK
jgi:hypothetical protein